MYHVRVGLCVAHSCAERFPRYVIKSTTLLVNICASVAKFNVDQHQVAYVTVCGRFS